MLELEAEEKAEKNWNDVMDGSDDVENVVAADPTDQNHGALQVEASISDLKDFDPPEEDGTPVTKQLPDDGVEILSDSASVVSGKFKVQVSNLDGGTYLNVVHCY